MTNPTYADVVGALSSVIDAYSSIDEMLDAFMSANDATDGEREKSAAASTTHGAAIEVFSRAVADTSLIHIAVSPEAHATILAALRFYQSEGMGDSANRSDKIHDIATNGDELTSLDEEGIDELCESIN